MHKPPFSITPKILSLCTDIGTKLGRYEGLLSPYPQPKLRKENQIKTIQGSLAIEGNTLNMDQVTAVIEGKPVVGDMREIREVQNALKAYELAPQWNPRSAKDLLQAHKIMMQGLVPDAGRWRNTNVGIIKGKHVTHMAPKPNFVPKLMSDLFAFLKEPTTLTLIKACVFHYELEFIHPFSDGNGRMGRLWQHVILLELSPAFRFVPVESLIKERQEDYYKALQASDKKGEATPFLEFSLASLAASLDDFLENLQPGGITAEERLARAVQSFQDKVFSRKDYQTLFKGISSATASRDLAAGVQRGILQRTGDKANARYMVKIDQGR